MATFIILAHMSEKGLREINDSTKRADAFRALAQSLDVEVKDLYWTVGRYDLVFVVEAPDDKVLTTLALSSGKLGYIRTETLRAFDQAEMESILSGVM
jgi:uncharacterized protein with GYD domain